MHDNEEWDNKEDQMRPKQVYKEQLKLKRGWDLEGCKERGGREEWKERVYIRRNKKRLLKKKQTSGLHIYIYMIFNTNQLMFVILYKEAYLNTNNLDTSIFKCCFFIAGIWRCISWCCS